MKSIGLGKSQTRTVNQNYDELCFRVERAINRLYLNLIRDVCILASLLYASMMVVCLLGGFEKLFPYYPWTYFTLGFGNSVLWLLAFNCKSTNENLLWLGIISAIMNLNGILLLDFSRGGGIYLASVVIFAVGGLFKKLVGCLVIQAVFLLEYLTMSIFLSVPIDAKHVVWLCLGCIAGIVVNRFQIRYNKKMIGLLVKNVNFVGEINELKKLIPICSYCKKIRLDDGYWEHLELYFSKKLQAKFSHGICPECLPSLRNEIKSTLDFVKND